MIATGVVRKLDNLGRIVIPKEIRRDFDLKEYDSLAIFVDDGVIILKKYDTRCAICGEKSNLKEFKEHRLCDDCIQKIGSL